MSATNPNPNAKKETSPMNTNTRALNRKLATGCAAVLVAAAGFAGGAGWQADQAQDKTDQALHAQAVAADQHETQMTFNAAVMRAWIIAARDYRARGCISDGREGKLAQLMDHTFPQDKWALTPDLCKAATGSRVKGPTQA